MTIAAVQLPLPLPEAFDYQVPIGLDLGVGDVVEVPLGKNLRLGVVWALKENDGEAEGQGSNLKAVIRRLDTPPFPANLRDFIDFIAR
ncbi:MAG: hypothetical protein RLZZ157_1636, partial [Pseudomonadota bacterium]